MTIKISENHTGLFSRNNLLEDYLDIAYDTENEDIREIDYGIAQDIDFFKKQQQYKDFSG